MHRNMHDMEPLTLEDSGLVGGGVDKGLSLRKHRILAEPSANQDGQHSRLPSPPELRGEPVRLE